MKTIAFLILNLLVLTSYSKADEPERNENIEIHIRQEWSIQITKKGIIAIQSSTDSHPMANAHTKEGAVAFNNIIKTLTEDSISLRDEDEARVKSVWAQIPGRNEKIAVSEESLFKILSIASNQWEFPGLTARLKERLNQHPLLADIQKQNQALHPTDGAVEPEKPKE
jgi:hypothetical protein